MRASDIIIRLAATACATALGCAAVPANAAVAPAAVTAESSTIDDYLRELRSPSDHVGECTPVDQDGPDPYTSCVAHFSYQGLRYAYHFQYRVRYHTLILTGAPEGLVNINLLDYPFGKVTGTRCDLNASGSTLTVEYETPGLFGAIYANKVQISGILSDDGSVAFTVAASRR